eukprot:1560928-Pyramimonas_sp.AAC.1
MVCNICRAICVVRYMTLGSLRGAIDVAQSMLCSPCCAVYVVRSLFGQPKWNNPCGAICVVHST